MNELIKLLSCIDFLDMSSEDISDLFLESDILLGRMIKELDEK